VPHARKIAYLAVILVGLTAAGLAIADQTRWAVAALGLGVAGIPVLQIALSRSLQRVREQIGGQLREQVGGQLRRQNKARLQEHRALVEQLSEQQESIRRIADAVATQPDPTRALGAIDRQVAHVQRQLNNLARSIESVASETVNLSRMQDRVVPGTTAMPVLGGWAATNRTIELLVDAVLNAEKDLHVVECGSGSSTVWVAAAMQLRGGGHVTALEHEAEFAEKTRAELRRRGLDAYATVLDAPLSALPGGEDGRIWYDTSVIAGLAPIDLLFVDGPPGGSGAEARRPAFDEFGALLNDGALVVLDDTNRGDEKRILDHWSSRTVAGRSLAIREHVGRATIMDVTRDA
jgi:predicted O-methyltransferase YrrM